MSFAPLCRASAQANNSLLDPVTIAPNVITPCALCWLARQAAGCLDFPCLDRLHGHASPSRPHPCNGVGPRGCTPVVPDHRKHATRQRQLTDTFLLPFLQNQGCLCIPRGHFGTGTAIDERLAARVEAERARVTSPASARALQRHRDGSCGHGAARARAAAPVGAARRLQAARAGARHGAGARLPRRPVVRR